MLSDREILIGVSGGIAAYKAADLVSRLVQAGAGISVIMTDSACELIRPKTFEALTRRPVRTSCFDERPMAHIELADKAELFCVAPATANVIAKAACGLADDLLSTVLLAFDGPILMAPAMNTRMWEKPPVMRNIKQLQEDGITMIGPDEGYLGCGYLGVGRMSQPETIFEAIVARLGAR